MKIRCVCRPSLVVGIVHEDLNLFDMAANSLLVFEKDIFGRDIMFGCPGFGIEGFNLHFCSLQEGETIFWCVSSQMGSIGKSDTGRM